MYHLEMIKKCRLVLIILLLSTSQVWAQQYINFQGKIATASGPINTTSAIFKFTMPDFPNWTYTISNVQVTNGLYSLVVDLPQGVFDSANYSRQVIVKYNGNNIDTVTIYVPVERDPTVRRYVRDSVFWDNIRNKPTVDTSIVNEIQVLSVNGDTLKLSKGGGNVLLPHVSDTLHSTTINGNLTVFDTTKNVMISIPQVGVVNTGISSSIWQSFKVTENGKLRQLKLTINSATPITIKFYKDIGNTSQLMAFTLPITLSSTNPQSIDISSLLSLPYLSVLNGELYTFEIIGNSISVLTNANNPYPFGVSSFGNNIDIPFELSIDNSIPPCLTFDSNCRVGIGTSSPSAQLEVKGRIKDQTGFLVPVGTVVAYTGRNIPQGWLLCDGRPISRTTYVELFETIDTSWGAGNSTGTFNLPDMRGMFLRGVDTSAGAGTTNNDLDHSARTASNLGGNTGNNVGSRQADQLASHSHTIFGPQAPTGITNGSIHWTNWNTQTYQSGYTGGSETRPKNVYVYYIIKY